MRSRASSARAAIIAGLVVVIGAAYNAIPVEYPLPSRIAQYLFFLPIGMSALWFGLRGGLLTALLSTLSYLPRMFQTGTASLSPDQFGEVLDLFLVAGVVGVLGDRERKQKAELERTTSELRVTYRQLEESLDHLKRVERLSAVGQLAANLAHEIRNPLAAIEGAADLLKPGAMPAADQEEFVGIVKKESRRLNRLLTDMLDYSRPRPPARAPASADEILRSVASLLAPAAQQSSVSIRVEPGPKNPGVECDQEQIKQVLVNLVMNAIQAMPDGGEIRLLSRAEGHRLALDVADEGTGVDPAQADRLFSPFFTTKPRGTGLGLSIAQQIVTRHEGEIRVTRNHPKGSVFSVLLPLARKTEEAA